MRATEEEKYFQTFLHLYMLSFYVGSATVKAKVERSRNIFTVADINIFLEKFTIYRFFTVLYFT